MDDPKVRRGMQFVAAYPDDRVRLRRVDEDRILVVHPDRPPMIVGRQSAAALVASRRCHQCRKWTPNPPAASAWDAPASDGWGRCAHDGAQRENVDHACEHFEADSSHGPHT